MKKVILTISVLILLLGTTAVYSATDRNEDNFYNGDKELFMNEWLDEEKLIAFDGEPEDHFGRSVSISGDYAIVGACYDDSARGSAYIYKRNKTRWALDIKLYLLDGQESDFFGCSVSIDGNYALVGAYGDNNMTGIAYVFKRKETGWYRQFNLTAHDGSNDDYFGYSVSIDYPRLIVGAYGDDEENRSNSGAAYIFVHGCCGWVEAAKLNASDAASNDFFGYSVSIDEIHCIVGSYGDDELGINSGSAYIFNRTTPDWLEEQKLYAMDGEEGDRFGTSVSLRNGIIIVGASFDDDLGENAGSAYIFNHNITSWGEIQKINALDGDSGDRFGSYVCIDELFLIVGAYLDDDNGIDSGSAYIFKCDGLTWSQDVKLSAYDGESNNRFGCSVSIDSNSAITGAFYDDDMGSNSGSAYVYRRQNHPPNVPTIEGPTIGKRGIKYNYTSCSSDPEGDMVLYLFDWDDFTSQDWIGPFPSGTEIQVNHTWEKQRLYRIKVKAKDVWGVESEWVELKVAMPRNIISINSIIQRLLERFPNAFPLLRLLVQRTLLQ